MKSTCYTKYSVWSQRNLRVKRNAGGHRGEALEHPGRSYRETGLYLVSGGSVFRKVAMAGWFGWRSRQDGDR